jgi:hypothetical protein
VTTGGAVVMAGYHGVGPPPMEIYRRLRLKRPNG